MQWRLGGLFLVVTESLAEAHSALIPHGHLHEDGSSLGDGFILTLSVMIALLVAIRSRVPRHG